MPTKKDLTIDKLKTVLDNAPTAIYVSALDDYRLLYLNGRAKEYWSIEDDYSGMVCYSMAGHDSPCPHCRIKEMSSEKIYVREFERPSDKRTYQLSGKIIDWDGIPAHIEYILDITDKKKKEECELSLSNNIKKVLGNIPCGLCLYHYDGKKIQPVFHSAPFYDLMGYSDENIKKVENNTEFLGVHPDDVHSLREEIFKAIQNNGVFTYVYRLWNDKLGEYRRIRLEGSIKESDDGGKLLYAVYSDITKQHKLESDLHSTQEKMEEIINSITGGVINFRQDANANLIPIFFSDGVPRLTGHTKEEYEALVKENSNFRIYEKDINRVQETSKAALLVNNGVVDLSFRAYHKDGHLVWLHLNGRSLHSTDGTEFYAVLTGMKEESRLFQSIADETADGVYVIDKDSYELLYANESKKFASSDPYFEGKKCYSYLHGNTEPCRFCILKTHLPDGTEHEIAVSDSQTLSFRFVETNWNGIPAYVLYLRDITEAVKTRREKERMEIYFHTLIKNLPGGIAVFCIENDGIKVPEYFSEGFAAMTKMTVEQAYSVFKDGVVATEDLGENKEKLSEYLMFGEGNYELTGRVLCGDNSYIWVKNNLTAVTSFDGVRRIYCVYTDITASVKEQEELKKQYEERIIKHHREIGPNTICVGHCYVAQDRIVELEGSIGPEICRECGFRRNEVFTQLSTVLTEEEERKKFLESFLNVPALAAYERGESEVVLRCRIKLPGEKRERFAQFKMQMIPSPNESDLTGILTVTDITEEVIEEKIMRQISLTKCDFVIDLNLDEDTYKTVIIGEDVREAPLEQGIHSERTAYFIKEKVVPKNREMYAKNLDPKEIRRRLEREGSYSFSFTIIDSNNETRTKNMTVSAIDLKLGRVSLVNTDITDTVREQQSLLNMLVYTFDIVAFIDYKEDKLTLYDKKSVLENLTPYFTDDYGNKIKNFINVYGLDDEEKNAVYSEFTIETMLKRLEKEPEGYEMVLPYKDKNGLRYKQIIVVWGDVNRTTICLVRADVTDVLTKERRNSERLESALALAEKANRAKSDFLSAMSHDMRTPMNAIMGMTRLAEVNLDDKERLKDCLYKISVSSKHLMLLINDVLDMSMIEQSRINFSRSQISVTELAKQLKAIIEPQAKQAELALNVNLPSEPVPLFFGDALRINQILINILGNAVKYTEKGGRIDFSIDVIPAKNENNLRLLFTVADTGVGMSDEFLNVVFQPFARSREAINIEGTGLGLSITKGLAESMGGNISVESKIGEGSIFRVELEFDKYESTAKETYPAIEERIDEVLDGRLFLIAEDNEINAEILCELIAMSGGRTVVAVNGKKAVEAFKLSSTGTYDAILMDVQMPQMNGYEATKAIRELDRADAKTVPIIAMTANAFAEDVKKSLAAGMNAHVAKPIDMELLASALKTSFKNGK